MSGVGSVVKSKDLKKIREAYNHVDLARVEITLYWEVGDVGPTECLVLADQRDPASVKALSMVGFEATPEVTRYRVFAMPLERVTEQRRLTLERYRAQYPGYVPCLVWAEGVGSCTIIKHPEQNTLH